MEVIVVNDGGEPEICEFAMHGADGIEIQWIHLPRVEGPASARNHGAARARGTYLAFLDDDCRPNPNWLKGMESALSSDQDCAAGGLLANAKGSGLYAAASHAVLMTAYRHHNPDGGEATFFVTANLAVPADRFREIGGFNPRLRASEDREFCERWIWNGYCLVTAAGAVVEHDQQMTFPGFWKRHVLYGKGAYRFRKIKAERTNTAIRLEPLAFYGALVTAPFREGFHFWTLWISLLVVISQVASTVGFLSEWRRARKKETERSVDQRHWPRNETGATDPHKCCNYLWDDQRKDSSDKSCIVQGPPGWSGGSQSLRD